MAYNRIAALRRLKKNIVLLAKVSRIQIWDFNLKDIANADSPFSKYVRGAISAGNIEIVEELQKMGITFTKEYWMNSSLFFIQG